MRLRETDAAFFNRCLAARDRWRLYPDFRHGAAFLDIETTGLSPYCSYITVVGVLDSKGYTAYVRGENLEDLREPLEKYALVMTYNGAAFDLPYIEYFFGGVFKHMAHIDLRIRLRRLGYRGGLKAIERSLKVGRSSELSGLTGFDAVLLWGMWESGDGGARDTLIRYNAEDVASLVALADIAYNQLAAKFWLAPKPLTPLPRPALDLPYDTGVVRRLGDMRAAAAAP